MATGLKLQELAISKDWELSGEHTEGRPSFTLEARFRTGSETKTVAIVFDEGSPGSVVADKLHTMADLIAGYPFPVPFQ